MSESGGTTPQARSERFQTAVTVLIALVSTVIALVASQAAVSSGNASEAQHNGVLAKINLERVDGGTRVQMARNRRAFTTYRFNRDLYDLTFQYVGQAEAAGSSPHGTRLRLEAAGQLEESNLAYQFIDSGYLIRDESGEYVDFDEDEFIKDRRQTASIYQDIDFEDNFAEADAMRVASLGLNASLLVWFVSLLFLTWAEITRSALRWVWLAAGLLLALGILATYALTGMLSALGLS
jgi:hypothetical protein